MQSGYPQVPRGRVLLVELENPAVLDGFCLQDKHHLTVIMTYDLSLFVFLESLPFTFCVAMGHGLLACKDGRQSSTMCMWEALAPR